MSNQLKGINVVVLFVQDLDQSRTFYRDTLGHTILFEDDASAALDFGGVMLMLLTTAGAQDLLSETAVATAPNTAARSQLVSFVEDVDAIYTELSAKGVEFIREPIDREWGMRTAHFKDSEGNIWELAQQLGSGEASDA
jgi:catechol 2,3-dioxygenase-like lactoylglutathione lyase family enzyme